MTTLPVRGDARARAGPAAAARADAAAARPAAAEAVALRGRVRARADAVRGQRARRRGAAALVGGGAAGRAAVRGAARRLRSRSTLGSGRRAVEVVSAHGGSYIWTRKQAGVPVSGSRAAPRTANYSVEGDYGFVDESAGYHARHTAWRWSAGVGVAPRRPVRGLEPGRRASTTRRVASERTVWVDGVPHGGGARRRSRRTCRRWATCASASGPRARTTPTCW